MSERRGGAAGTFKSWTEVLQARARRYPERRAYTFIDGRGGERHLTYGELERRVRSVAAGLQAQDRVGERALLLFPHGPQFAVAFLACLYAGTIAVPAYPPRPRRRRGGGRGMERLRAIAADCRPSLALGGGSVPWGAGGHRALPEELVGVEWRTLDEVAAPGDAWQDPDFGPGAPALIQYTSGSTAAPKGVVVSHGNLLCNSEQMRRAFGLGAGSLSVSWVPLFHDMGLILGFLQPLYTGFPGVLLPPAYFAQRPLRWLEVISRHRATTSGGPNIAFDLCAERISPEARESLDLSCWREVAYCGAEPVRRETLERFAELFAPCGFRREVLLPAYGLAEATLMVSATPADRPPLYLEADGGALEGGRIERASSEAEARSLVSCGRVASGTRVVIVAPETCTPLPDGTVGEIWVAGRTVALGYWGREEETERTFRARLVADASGPEGPFLRTGDLGLLREGELFVTGRLKDLIIIRGRNHYPQDLELTAERSHPALRPGGGAAFSVESGGEERLILVQEVRRHASREETGEAIQDIREAVVQDHEVQPASVVLVRPGTVPKTSSGKIRRAACRAEYLEDALAVVESWRAPVPVGTAPAAPAGADATPREIGRWLAAWLASRLGVPVAEIDPRTPFARLGLDSVTGAALTGDLEAWLGRPVPPPLLYERPTVRSLSGYLAGEVEAVGERAGAAPATTPAAPAAGSEPVAIVGIGCRFPGAPDPKSYWELLRGGVEAVGELPEGRLGEGAAGLPREARVGGFLPAVDSFDPHAFGLSPGEAERMDPQQRLLLEVTWEALEDAGLAPEPLAGSAVGVFVGIATYDYARIQGQAARLDDAFAGTGTAQTTAANRLSYQFDFWGPSVAVDTACSSSLVAVHLACQCLAAGDAELAVAGGVNLILDPAATSVFAAAGLISRQGRCRAFDAQADGYVRGEGAGMVVLKPLSRAVAEGDRIYAVIRGSAVNQDGRSNGLTAPNPEAQREVLRQAYHRAGVAPAEVSYVEAHGSGTPLGDPIEVGALAEILGESRRSGVPCAIGSVKTNLGHLEAAAGIAGLIKTALALERREIPPSLHFEEPNPGLPFDRIPIAVQRETGPWPGDPRRAVAGVSSFGFGGTNAHAVLSAPPDPPPRDVSREWVLLPLSAGTPHALKASGRRLAAHLKAQSECALADAAHTLQAGRRAMQHRLAVVCRDRREAVAALAGDDPKRLLQDPAGGAVDEVAFLLPGVGDPYPGLGRELYGTEPVFRREMDRAAEVLRPLLEADLRELLFAPAGEEGDGADGGLELRRMLGRGGGDGGGELHRTSVAHPAVFAVNCALARLWISWGVRPAALLGYSIGECAAAHLAGVLSFEDALRVVARRARLIEGRPAGSGLAVPLPEAEVEPLVAGELSIAALNGPSQTVVSGPEAAVGELADRLADDGVACRRLPHVHAFHFRALEPVKAQVAELFAGIDLRPPGIPYLSNLTGTWIRAEEATDPAYWVDQMCSPVRFAAGLAELTAAPGRALLEVGPGATLSALALQGAAGGDEAPLVVSSLRQGYESQADRAVLLQALGRLWLAGVEVDWQGVGAGERRRVVSLPTYPFQRERYWLATPAAEPAAAGREKGKRREIADWFYLPTWKRTLPPPVDPAAVAAAGDTWLLFLDEEGLGQAVAERLKSWGQTVVTVQPAEGFAKRGAGAWALDLRDAEHYDRLLDELGGIPERIVHLPGVTGGGGPEPWPEGFARAQDRGFYSLLFLTQALARRHSTDPVAIWLVSDGVFRVTGTEALRPEKATVVGASRVVSQEYMHLTVRLVDVALPPAGDSGRGRLVDDLVHELAAGSPDLDVALRGRDRWVQVLDPLRVEAVQSLASGLREGGVYLITGGLGKVGSVLAEFLARETGGRLVLVGRSELPPESRWDAHLAAAGGDDPLSLRILRLRALRELAAEVVVERADVAEAGEIEAVVERTLERYGALHGVIHAAGVLDERTIRPIQEMDRVGCEGQFRSKAHGLAALEGALEGVELDFCVLMSSLTALLGGLQYAAYGAANSFMDAFAHRHNGEHPVPWISMDSDIWQVAGVRPGSFGATVNEFEMAPEEGVEAFRRLLAMPRVPQVAVSTGDLLARFQQWLAVGSPPGEAPGGAEAAPAAARRHGRPRLSSPYEPPSTKLERTITGLWQEILGLDRVGIHDNFFELGGHSLLATRFTLRLRESYPVDLNLRSLFDTPTPAALSRAIETMLWAGSEPVPAAAGAGEVEQGEL